MRVGEIAPANADCPLPASSKLRLTASLISVLSGTQEIPTGRADHNRRRGPHLRARDIDCDSPLGSASATGRRGARPSAERKSVRIWG
ncbi:MAG: hypothetical protein RL385_729 [Pseudomonadota bacterium]|jgi:hypothetical protein